MSVLQVTVGGVTQHFPPSAGEVRIGRSAASNVVVPESRVSRRHLVVSYDGGWTARDQESSGGTWRAGVQVGEVPVNGAVELTLGGPSGPAVSLSVPPPQAAPPRPPGTIRIGRAPDNDLVIDDLLTARYHARLTPNADGWYLEDLDKHHQTFVRGADVETAQLHEGDVVTFGKVRFVVTRDGVLPVPDSPSSGGLDVADVHYALPGGKVLTSGVSLDIAGQRLVALIGPSGSGKSTLLRLISGELEPSQGSVHYQGINPHRQQEEVHGRIGVVPQHTIAHAQLTARKALQYAAELRLSQDTTAAERRQRVDDVLAELSLSEHADIPVRRMSGGQQRRLAIAFELLTSPSLLILDEPTAGLDPALVRQIMTGLRELADAGRQIIVTTHDLAHLDLCDDVLIMLPGGRVEYFGPPAGISAHFGTADWADIFERLNAATPPPPPPAAAGPGLGESLRRLNPLTWLDRLSGFGRPDAGDPSASARRLARLGAAAGPLTAGAAPEIVGPQAIDQRRRRQQSWVLIRRQLRLIWADRGYAGFLLALPMVLALLTFAIPDETGLGRPTSPGSTEAMRLLVVMVVGAAFMGMAATVRDLVAERRIFRHERAAGLMPDAYLAAKIAVFCGVVVVQTLILLRLVYWFRAGPEDGVLFGTGKVEVGIALAATAIVSALLGLLISSLVATPEQTMPPLVVAIMAQLVLCGGLIEVTGQAVVSQLSWLVPARWGYAAAASTVDVTELIPSAPDDALWSHNAAAWLGALLALTVLGTAYAWLTRRRLRAT
ncbi:ATP-binding cassette domain-containing protein [Jiangella alkaliphila]|uniref:ABC-type multidrug transport system, ATPase component n=1 Tax=Jiangella alkaliphila TaxID=419479 RepID=A0A1H2JL58_9ACTN|nr:ATP-binding cassette domain-containing protein [Jiangella alkaliphila]SDU56805.1 ABC-type multidrug transport system, ATPase component [Jiangella alkaliphila]